MISLVPQRVTLHGCFHSLFIYSLQYGILFTIPSLKLFPPYFTSHFPPVWPIFLIFTHIKSFIHPSFSILNINDSWDSASALLTMLFLSETSPSRCQMSPFYTHVCKSVSSNHNESKDPSNLAWGIESSVDVCSNAHQISISNSEFLSPEPQTINMYICIWRYISYSLPIRLLHLNFLQASHIYLVQKWPILYWPPTSSLPLIL